MNVPFVDFSQQYEVIKDSIDAGLKKVFEKGNFILGDEVKEFESTFASFCGAQYAIGVGSGTDALYLALSSFDVGPGDEVILPTHTFIATALCISYTGAKPVFVDIEEDTYNMDPACFEAAVTDKTKAVIPVHIYGQPANMDEINVVAKKHNIKVIEDGCQAHGAMYKGKKVGALGDVGCFSFYPTKSLGGAGDGGLIVTDDKEVFDKCNMLRDYGRQGRYEHKIKGYNSRLDTLQAVVLLEKLKFLDEWNGLRADVAKMYEKQLSGADGITVPSIQPDRTHVFHLYVIRVSDRDRILEKLKEKGIGALIHYPIALHLQEAYQDLGHSKGDFPVTEKVADEIISLPMFPHMSKEQVEYVSTNLKELVGAVKA